MDGPCLTHRYETRLERLPGIINPLSYLALIVEECLGLCKGRSSFGYFPLGKAPALLVNIGQAEKAYKEQTLSLIWSIIWYNWVNNSIANGS